MSRCPAHLPGDHRSWYCYRWAGIIVRLRVLPCASRRSLGGGGYGLSAFDPPVPRDGLMIAELLVVLGVLGVLLGIFLTVVFAVRRKVDAVHCVSNLHQLGHAIAMYAEDH